MSDEMSAVTRPLGELVEILSGFPFKSEAFSADPNEGTPLIRIRDIKTHTPSCSFVGDYDPAYLISDGDIIIGMDGEFTAVRWRGVPALLNQRVLKIRSSHPDLLDDGYLFHRIQSDLAHLETVISGTTVKHLSVKDLRRLEWHLPPLDEQQRIAEVLRSVDESIRLNRRTAEQAECALMSARQHLTGLDGSEAGWTHKPLLECFQLQRGHDLPVQNRNDGDVLVIASNGPVGFHDQAPIPAPAVITGRSGTIGKVTYFDGPCWPLNTTLFVRDFKGSDPRYVYHFLSAFPLAQHATGTGVPTLNRNDVHAVKVGWPEPEEQDRRARVLDSLETSWRTTQAAFKAYRSLKERLASDLLSGRVRVPV